MPLPEFTKWITSEQRAHGVDVDAADHGRLRGHWLPGTTRREILRVRAFERNRECAADAAHAAIEREFADEEAVVDFLSSEAAVGADDAEGHGKIEAGAFLLYVGGARLMVMWVGGMS